MCRERYLAGATYVTSRAFPSSLLAQKPTLVRDPSTEPVLIPGLDLLNHARGAAVTWSVAYPSPDTPDPTGQSQFISVVLHDPAESQQEIYNNYGPKPNSELILGYGFSLRHNPEDSVLLKVGGLDGQRWSVGRDGHGMQGLWNEIVQWIREEAEGDCEDQVEAADLLTEMAQMFLERMPQAGTQGILGVAQGMRGEVALMLQDYVSGTSVQGLAAHG